MNKTVGIITYQDIADGKGRFLQAYALYCSIIKLGYDAEIIDYIPANKEQSRVLKKGLRILTEPAVLRGYISKLQQTILIRKYKKEFSRKRSLYNDFIKKNISLTGKKYKGSEALRKANLRYDAYVCGSDQIWNPYFQGLDKTYYLSFAPEQKRVAYAPSLGTVQIDDKKKEFLKENIKQIPYVSVREKSGARLISDLIQREVQCVLDPTFLLPEQWWNELAEGTKPRRPYVLTFFFDNSKYPRKIAKEIAKKFGYDVISIPDSFADMFFTKNKEIGIGPERFVSLFKNASFICTQSFHGTVLSLIYKRPFYVFDRQTKAYVGGVFSRIQNLLEKVGLEDRILKVGQVLPEEPEEIDFGTAKSIIEIDREKSLEYLRDALDKATRCE